MRYEVENPMVRPIKEPKVVGVAFCSECHARLFSDEEFLELGGDYFCDDSCLKRYLGVQTVVGWELV